ncbi:muscle M-line assembly protein unc-89-like [Panicum miliaceum]|uniref:Muscle M-line assembly protein unc-89-like n=1 Tax=Panicum miliaceum TaxID=4540 RepID=A0A3L6T1Q4_PANMI|nr:muscle M-line assembly protein unc-89-like [Panicum miliaceum]
MTEEVIKEVITSTPASAEPKCEDLLINSPVITDGTSMLPDVKSKEKPVPHYLRASSRSCHDNCKYGIKHSSEPKKYWPISRKQLRRASTGNHEHSPVEIRLPKTARPIKEDQKLKNSHEKDGDATAPGKPEFTNPKAPLESAPDHFDSISCLEDLSGEASEPIVAETLPTDAECFVITHDDVADCEDGVSSNGAESIELEMPLAIQDIDECDEHTEDAILPANNVLVVDHVSDQSANECASSDKRTTRAVIASEKQEQAALGTKSKSSVNEPVKPKVKATSSVTRNIVSSQRNGRASHPKATGAAVERSSGPKTTRKTADATATKKFSNPERKFSSNVASAAQKAKEIKVPSSSSATDSAAKPARLAKLKSQTVKSAPSPPLSSGKQIERKITEKKVVKNAQVLQKEGDEKVVPGPLKLSRSVNMSGKSISSLRLKSIRKDKIAPPIKSSKKVSETENSAADAKSTKEKILKMASPKVRKPEVNNKESRPPRKEKPDTSRTAIARRAKPAPITPSSTVAPAPQPRKLTFRRGKVLNPADSSSSSSAPRRLRFRPAMAAADASAARSRGSRITGRRSGGSAAARDAGAEVVVLRRRQDGKEAKKQEQVLLNNVIEETASRLVAEARKSKVKALVGAFETVISLQETGKAAAPVAAASVAP